LKIQFFSDTHLEFGTFNIPETKADVIVAAGDIGVGTQGIEWLAQNQKPIIYVAGHHEYYYGDIVHTRIAIAELAHATPVSFLENDVCEIDGFRFLGATLWTDYFDGNPTVMCEAVKKHERLPANPLRIARAHTKAALRCQLGIAILAGAQTREALCRKDRRRHSSRAYFTKLASDQRYDTSGDLLQPPR